MTLIFLSQFSRLLATHGAAGGKTGTVNQDMDSAEFLVRVTIAATWLASATSAFNGY